MRTCFKPAMLAVNENVHKLSATIRTEFQSKRRKLGEKTIMNGVKIKKAFANNPVKLNILRQDLNAASALTNFHHPTIFITGTRAIISRNMRSEVEAIQTTFA